MSEGQGERGMDRRRFLKTVIGGVAALSVAGAFPGVPKGVPPARAGQPGNFDGCRLVVFGSDGLRVDYARTLATNGAPALGLLHNINPIICSLNNGLSCTQPGWTTVWTGMPSCYTRVYANTQYGELPEQMHIMRKIFSAYRNEDLFLVWITGKGKQLAGKKRKLHAGTPDEQVVKGPHFQVKQLVEGLEQPGVYHGDVERTNLEVYELAYDALQESVNHRNFCCFVHFQDPDQTGHAANSYGSYMDAALEVDNYIRDLIEQMGLLDSSKIVYCSDHGFDFKDRGDTNVGHKYSPQGMLATNFETNNYPVVDMCSVGRLIYKLAGGNPDKTKYVTTDGISTHSLYGTDLI